jgi:uncharacterized protein (DUF2236 family)
MKRVKNNIGLNHKTPESGPGRPSPEDHIIDNSYTKQSSDNSDGFFAPDSMICRIENEAVVMLGGGYAILLQLAHPFIAAGVDDYSRFQAEILDRLYRTVLFLHRLVFDDRQSARQALRNFHHMHQNITGQLKHRTNRLPADTEYSGIDPEAKLWVYASFIDTSLRAYQRFVKPLSREERNDFHQDCLLLARLLEIPDPIVPDTPDDFDMYMKNMLSGDTLEVTATAKHLAQNVIYPEVGFFPRLSAVLLRFVTAGFLPARFRKDFGLNWSRKHEFVFNSLSKVIRFLRPYTPAWIWQTPRKKSNLTGLLLWGLNKDKK